MRRSALGTLALSALLLAGCSEEPQLKTTPDPTETPSTSAAASEPSSSVPNAESAEQFLRRWARLGDEAADSGNTKELSKLQTKDCASCNKFIRTITTVYAAGGDIKQPTGKVPWVKNVGKGKYHVRLSSRGTQMRPTPDTDWIKSPGGEYTMMVELRKARSSWLVQQYSPIAGSES